MKDDELNREIYNRYGAVTRARGCHLYTKKGVRLTDLYQMNGRAILGWGGGDAFTRFKNILNRGVTGNYITEYDSQILVAVEKLLQKKCAVVWTVSREKAEKIAEIFGKFVYYKPWNPEKTDYKNEKTVVFEPALPWTDNLFLVCVEKSLFDSKVSENKKDSVIDGDFVPSPLKAAVTRSVYDLMEALSFREEKHWFIYDKVITRFWERKGPYLFTKVSENKYDDFVKACLDCGLVINPDFNKPSIIPFGADKGVFTALRDLDFGV